MIFFTNSSILLVLKLKTYYVRLTYARILHDLPEVGLWYPPGLKVLKSRKGFANKKRTSEILIFPTFMEIMQIMCIFKALYSQAYENQISFLNDLRHVGIIFH